MAAPVAALPLPGDTEKLKHLLYTLNEQSQIALELRSTTDRSDHRPYKDNGTSPGYIKNPSSFAAIIEKGLVSPSHR